MRKQADSQIVEWEELRNTAEDYKNRDGEIHHAAINMLAYVQKLQWHLAKLVA